MLTRDQILSMAPRVKEILIPEWGGNVFIRPLTLLEVTLLGELSTKILGGEDGTRPTDGAVKVVLWGVCDDKGQPIFTDADMPILIKHGVSVFSRIQEEVMAFSGITKEAREELEKNWLSAQSASPAS